MSGHLFADAFNLAWPPLWALAWSWMNRYRPAWWRLPLSLGMSACGCLIGAASVRNWPSVVISVGYIAAAVVIWHRRNRRRRRTAALIGAKSRALRDAMVRRVRETAQPRPVLRPVPQGAP
jgi:hypothetical protein